MKEIDRLIKQRDDFLKENPHLQKYQDEINRILSKTPQDNKLEVLSIILSNKLLELQSGLIDLTKILMPK